MGYEVKSLFRIETTRLLWLPGIMVALIVTLQCLELPHGNVLSSLFPPGKVPVAENSDFLRGRPSSESEKVADATHVNGLNSTGLHAPNETVNNTLSLEVKDRDLDDGVLQANVGLNISSGFDEGSKSGKESSTETSKLSSNSTTDFGQSFNNKTEAEEVSDAQGSFSPKNETMYDNSPKSNVTEGNITLTSESNGYFNASLGSPVPASSPTDSSTNVDLGKNADTKIRKPVISINSTTSSGEKNVRPSEKPVQMQDNLKTPSPEVKEKADVSSSAVITIHEMNNLLHQSHDVYHSVTPRWSSAVDQELLAARSQTENAPIIKNDVELFAPLYRNISMFKRSYELMEEKLKVYVYREGKRPILHLPLLKGIYASEGWFMRQLETNKKFVTKNPGKAHLFYLPFSSKMLEEALYVQNSHSHDNLIQFLKNYVDMIASKYPFWNRTEGADHFLVACHDWAPVETKKYMANCIRALCNSDVKEGYIFGKDVSLPETYVRNPQKPLRDVGGKPPSKRSILAFFAGNMHGYLRPILLQHWENKDPDMKILGNMPKVKGKMDYIQHMKSSKYCLCPRGYEVNSPRVVEAIFYECVPVIISDNFVPPFFEVLNWESFAVFVSEKDIPNLKNILLSIPQKRYLQLQLRVKKVQQHFLWHPKKPQKYDVFHMILHSVWYNRVFQTKHG
ncbi:hypothetical protein SLE2022_036250 [Rubroshorea leprosula]